MDTTNAMHQKYKMAASQPLRSTPKLNSFPTQQQSIILLNYPTRFQEKRLQTCHVILFNGQTLAKHYVFGAGNEEV